MLPWLAAIIMLAGCGNESPVGDVTVAVDTGSTVPESAPDPSTPSTSTSTTTLAAGLADPHAPPEWLGTRPLQLRPDGFGVALPTPVELVGRQIRTVDVLPPPAGGEFSSVIAEASAEVLARSSWTEDCPVPSTALRYVTVSFVGFEGDLHTGEFLVHRDAAEGLVAVFRRLFDLEYPIEEVRVRSADELAAHPTGDGNVTSVFECRLAVGSTGFSQHAYGLAIDLNPFQNPYVRGDLVIPELAGAYVDRDSLLPGMIAADDDVVSAFSDIGWSWGGNWTSLKDYHHFSANGR